MSMFIEAALTTGANTEAITLEGNCDVLVEGLLTGSVKLQYMLPASAVKTSPSWTDWPGGEFTADVYKKIFVSERGVAARLLGVSNTSGVYVRLARGLNK